MRSIVTSTALSVLGPRVSDNRQFEVVDTREGARAILDKGTGEVMHPVIGPLREAEELYLELSGIKEMLETSDERPLVLYDVGLGAGSNALAAWKLSEARIQGRPLQIISFDRTVDAMRLALEPENVADFGFESSTAHVGRQLLRDGSYTTTRTSWRLVLGELPSTLRDELPRADAVFYDPFSPNANPELWSVGAFRRLYAACNDRAVVLTYSAATAVRSSMLLAGFHVGRGHASGARSETTIATRKRELTEPSGDDGFSVYSGRLVPSRKMLLKGHWSRCPRCRSSPRGSSFARTVLRLFPALVHGSK